MSDGASGFPGDGGGITFDTLILRARALLGSGTRRLLGIAGPPGAGKSTLAAALCEALGPVATHVSLDGFHLDNQVLATLGMSDRKGAPETFDGSGFRSLLQRLHTPTDDVVYAPQFRRELELAIAGACPIHRDIPLVVIEGNYLLLDEGAWAEARGLLHETWYIDLDDRVRQERLSLRHQDYGRSADEAAAWTYGSDERNAAIVKDSRDRADVVIPSAAIVLTQGERRT